MAAVAAQVRVAGASLLVVSEGLEASYPLSGVQIEPPLSRLRRV